MKCKFITIAALAISLASCQKNIAELETISQPLDQEKSEFTVNVLPDIPTKTQYSSATGADNVDKAINSIQVLVFNAGVIEYYAKKESASSVTINCTKGTKNIYVVANGTTDLSTVQSEKELTGKTVDLIENTPTSLVMAGKAEKVTLPDVTKVDITVSRLVCRVSLDKITRNYTTAALNALTTKIVRIFLINVPAHNNYSMNLSSETSWYNEEEVDLMLDSKIKSLIHEDLSDSLTSSSPSCAKTHTFYAMPSGNNPSDMPMRLVIHASVGGKQSYYPINLPALEANQAYQLKNLTIKRIGSNDPNVPVSSEDIEYDIVKVNDWNKDNTVEELAI